MSIHIELPHLRQMDCEHLILLTHIVPTGLYHPYFCCLVLKKLLIVNLIPIFKKRLSLSKELNNSSTRQETTDGCRQMGAHQEAMRQYWSA